MSYLQPCLQILCPDELEVPEERLDGVPRDHSCHLCNLADFCNLKHKCWLQSCPKEILTWTMIYLEAITWRKVLIYNPFCLIFIVIDCPVRLLSSKDDIIMGWVQCNYIMSWTWYRFLPPFPAVSKLQLQVRCRPHSMLLVLWPLRKPTLGAQLCDGTTHKRGMVTDTAILYHHVRAELTCSDQSPAL